MMRQIQPKIWIPVIVVILLAVGLALFFTWPREEKAPEVIAPEVTPEEEITLPEIPADWKTYKNEEYGFEVKHPEEFQIEEGGPTYELGVFYFGSGPYEYRISLVISNISPEKYSLPFPEEIRQELTKIEGAKEIQIREITVDKEKGILYTYEIDVPAGFERGVEYEAYTRRIITAQVIRGDKLYEFHLARSINYSEIFEFFDQMLSSFQFID
jgi:hypothetical protein